MSNNSSIYFKSIQLASAGCTIVSSLLSIFGAFIIFWTYWRVCSLRNFPRTLLIWLTVADLLNASGYLFRTIDFVSNNGTNNDVCIAQSIVTTFASMASFLWTLVITVHMMIAIQFRSDKTRSVILKVLYHVICWGIPGVITIVASLKGVLGRTSDTNTAVTGTWCWIKDDITYTERIKWMLLAGKSWEILCYVLSFSILVLLKLKLYLSRSRLSELETDFRDEDTHYLYMWLLLWLFRVWGTVRFILVWFRHTNDFESLTSPQSIGDLALIFLQSIGDSAQAFGNCVLFCFLDKVVVAYIKDICISSKCDNVEHERLIPTSEG